MNSTEKITFTVKKRLLLSSIEQKIQSKDNQYIQFQKIHKYNEMANDPWPMAELWQKYSFSLCSA